MNVFWVYAQFMTKDNERTVPSNWTDFVNLRLLRVETIYSAFLLLGMLTFHNFRGQQFYFHDVIFWRMEEVTFCTEKIFGIDLMSAANLKMKSSKSTKQVLRSSEVLRNKIISIFLLRKLKGYQLLLNNDYFNASGIHVWKKSFIGFWETTTLVTQRTMLLKTVEPLFGSSRFLSLKNFVKNGIEFFFYHILSDDNGLSANLLITSDRIPCEFECMQSLLRNI